MKPGTIIKIKKGLDKAAIIDIISKDANTGAYEELKKTFIKQKGRGKILKNTYNPENTVRILFKTENMCAGFYYNKDKILKYFYFGNIRIYNILYGGK